MTDCCWSGLAGRSLRAGGRYRAVLHATTILASVGAAGLAQAADPASPPGVMVLPPVQVQDQAPAAPAADGYVATRTSTATKIDTPLRDVPQSVTVVTEQAIEDQAMHGIADVVRYVPGITAGQGEGNRDQLTIRGNNSTADFFTDGVRDDVQYYRDLYNVDRVEALKGPNGMIFGRGGGGGVINRVLKEADGSTVRQIGVQAGSFETKRTTLDVGQAITPDLSGRVNAVYENSGSYRDHVEVERYGINPTLTWTPREDTSLKLGYEYFHDDRTADRGIPSFQGRPLDVDASTFFGNPDLSFAEVDVHAVDATVTHEFGQGLTIRNRSRYASYDKFYQNVFPGAVNATGTTVNLSAYNNATERENLFNQTDLMFTARTGGLTHKLLTGVELGRQATDSFRNTGFFPGDVTSFAVPLGSPTVSTPVVFRQRPTDADSSSTALIAAAYVQDQIEITEQWQLIAGLRFDHFGLDFHNNRTGQDLSRNDNLVSPRLGLIYKPIEPLSLYASYSVSYLPGSGDQFSSLTATTSALEPEKFENFEIGAKWDLYPDLALTAALFQLDRTNTTAPDPNNPGQVLQTGSQRTRGLEIGVAGNITEAWQIAGGYAYQDAEITSDTSAASAGSTVALVPRHTFSLWNRYQFTPMWGAGLGLIHQTEMYAGADNAVTLPSFTRVDAAVYANVTEDVRLQLNVQNLFDTEYYATAHSNNNITPGAPRTVWVTMTADF